MSDLPARVGFATLVKENIEPRKASRVREGYRVVRKLEVDRKPTQPVYETTMNVNKTKGVPVSYNSKGQIVVEQNYFGTLLDMQA